MIRIQLRISRSQRFQITAKNKGYRKYLKLDRETVAVNQEKIEEEARYDGKWVLKTNITLTAEQVALKYKELWQVEQVFRDMKSVLDTRPIFPSVR